jgi:DNA-binding MarR family transcriptional regulator
MPLRGVSLKGALRKSALRHDTRRKRPVAANRSPAQPAGAAVRLPAAARCASPFETLVACCSYSSTRARVSTKTGNLHRLTSCWHQLYTDLYIHVKRGGTVLLNKLNLSGTGFCASFNFRRTSRAVTRLFDLALEGTGIRSTQFTILVGIAKAQPASIGALAEILTLDPTTLTRSLRPLQQDGLVAVSPRSAMRQRFLTLTAKGERQLATTLPQWRKIQATFESAVGCDHWLHLRAELEHLADVAKTLEEQHSHETVQV